MFTLQRSSLAPGMPPLPAMQQQPQATSFAGFMPTPAMQRPTGHPMLASTQSYGAPPMAETSQTFSAHNPLMPHPPDIYQQQQNMGG
jgi:hypothetical protein